MKRRNYNKTPEPGEMLIVAAICCALLFVFVWKIL